ncbi:MAG: OsmC family protein [Minwuiales bacterium]|nr:OsmC family protein [Minwuiales bacterium]
MSQEHHYRLRTTWTGAVHGPTTKYNAYSREHTIEMDGKPMLTGSADAAFLGDAALYNPEDLLVAALSSCHMLAYLATCASARVPILAYQDDATGTMLQKPVGGHFTEVTLRPRVTIANADQIEKARELHAVAARQCFIAGSVNFPVHHIPEIEAAGAAA